ncbi:MAG: SurA N-terminal domain-containing protein [Eubacterium sp.]|nr:SurA N-terminal domain-containing protein [Eubacterium sp.]
MNNNQKKMARFALSLLLSASVFTGLTSCGSGEGKDQEAVKLEDAVSVDSGALKNDSCAIAVGDTPVTYEEYKAYYYFMENQYTELLGEEVFRRPAGKDKTIGQEAIEEVLRLIIQVKVICKEAEKQGVVLEADEKEDAKYSAEKYIASVDKKTASENGINSQMITKIFEENKIAQKMYYKVTGNIESTLTEDQTNAYRVQLIFKKAEGDKAVQKNDMETLRGDIQSSDKSFYLLAEKESDNPEIEAVIGPMDSRKNLFNAIMKTKTDTISPVVEEADGFYLAFVLEKPNEELNKEYQNEVISKMQTDTFQSEYDKWSKNYDVAVSDSLLSN